MVENINGIAWIGETSKSWVLEVIAAFMTQKSNVWRWERCAILTHTKKHVCFVGIGPLSVSLWDQKPGIPIFLSPSYHLPSVEPPLSKGTRTVASNPSWQHRAFASKRFFSKTSLHLNTTIAGGFNPFTSKYVCQNGSFSQVGAKKKCLNPPPRKHVFIIVI